MFLKLYLTVAVSIASCERSFSKLKLIKSYLRSTMGESRQPALAILSIESDFVEMLSFEDVILDFVSVKARRFNFELLIRIKLSILFFYCIKLHSYVLRLMVLKGGSSCKNPRAAGYVATPLLGRRRQVKIKEKN